jgi:protein TonB
MPRLRKSTALSWVASGVAHAGVLALGTLAAISVGRREWERNAEETVIAIRLSPPSEKARASPLSLEVAVDDRSRVIEPQWRPDALPRTEGVLEDPLELARALVEGDTAAERDSSRGDRGVSFEARTVPGLGGRGASRPGVGASATSEGATTVADGAGDGLSSIEPGAPPEPGSGGAGGMGPRAIEAPEPEYPKLSIRLGEEGRVGCVIEVDESGRVTSVVVTTGSGHPRLDRAALEALQSWRFDPARRDGVAIAARVPHVVVFRLR